MLYILLTGLYLLDRIEVANQYAKGIVNLWPIFILLGGLGIGLPALKATSIIPLTLLLTPYFLIAIKIWIGAFILTFIAPSRAAIKTGALLILGNFVIKSKIVKELLTNFSEGK